MKGKLLISIWVVCMLQVAMAKFNVEKNSLRVTSPKSLKDVYECAIGNFGIPQYGGTMHGSVVYPKSDQKACKSFSEFDLGFQSKPGSLPVFLLVDRDDCYFTTKAWNAQNGGAAAILVVDDRIRPLITMDTPEDGGALSEFIANITIPSVLITKKLGDSLKKALDTGDMVSISLDWRESLPHPDERVEYEFWTNINDKCGSKCDTQINFNTNFEALAQTLEKKGYTQFTPHYITWYCPEAFIVSKQCKSQCINKGRYCAPDPEEDFGTGYDGKDVVVQNLYQLCAFKVANETGKPWVWWDYVTDFATRCPMKDKKYTSDCADQVATSLGFDMKKMKECIGDSEADAENPVLKADQDSQKRYKWPVDVTNLEEIDIFWKYCTIRWERIVKEMYDFMYNECTLGDIYIDLWYQRGVNPERKIMPVHTNHGALMRMVSEWLYIKPAYIPRKQYGDVHGNIVKKYVVYQGNEVKRFFYYPRN